MKTCILSIVLILCSLRAKAQRVDTTGQLDSIMVLAKAVNPLGQPSTIDRATWQIGKLAARSEEALLYLPGVHIRQRGAGQIATLQYRGLQGARIAQTWQGIPVSNPQIGSGDANELHLALVDRISIGSPTNIGNAAAVAVSQNAGGPTTLTARYAQGMGVLASGKWKGLRVLFQNDQHNFLHSFNGSAFRTERTGTFTNILGASFTGTYGEEWSSSSYYLVSNRRLRSQRPDLGTGDANALRTTTIRQVFSWTSDTTMRLDIGGLFDAQSYALASQDESKGATFQPLVQFQVQLAPHLRLTTDNRILFSKHTEYIKTSLLPQTRTLLRFSSAFGQLTFDATGGINARINSEIVPFASATLDGSLSTTGRFQIGVRRIGRLPTLDDQLWSQGGISDLSPEQGWAIHTSSEVKVGTLVLTPLLFARRFSNYILWLPRGSFWQPNSIPAVNNFGGGLDVSGRLVDGLHALKFLGTVSYSELRLAREHTLENGVELDADEDLPFSPRLTGSFTLDYVYGRWSCIAQGRYTGKQETSYNGLTQADPHAVLRTAVSHQLKTLAVSLSCDNLTNTIIPNDFGLFSPLRRFELTLNYTPKI